MTYGAVLASELYPVIGQDPTPPVVAGGATLTALSALAPDIGTITVVVNVPVSATATILVNGVAGESETGVAMVLTAHAQAGQLITVTVSAGAGPVQTLSAAMFFLRDGPPITSGQLPPDVMFTDVVQTVPANKYFSSGIPWVSWRGLGCDGTNNSASAATTTTLVNAAGSVMNGIGGGLMYIDPESTFWCDPLNGGGTPYAGGGFYCYPNIRWWGGGPSSVVVLSANPVNANSTHRMFSTALASGAAGIEHANFTLDGNVANQPLLLQDHAELIFLDAAVDPYCHNCFFRNTPSDGWHGHNATLRPRVIGNHVEGSARPRVAINISTCTGGVVEANTIDGWSNYPFKIETNNGDPGAIGNIVQGNTLTNCAAIISASGASGASRIKRLMILGNNCGGNGVGAQAVNLFMADNCTVEGNTIDSVVGSNINLGNDVQGCLVSNNTITNAVTTGTAQYAINVGGAGTTAVPCTDIDIVFNQVIASGAQVTGIGVRLNGTTAANARVTIMGNSIISCGGFGISCNGGIADGEIAFNTIYNCGNGTSSFQHALVFQTSSSISNTRVDLIGNKLLAGANMVTGVFLVNSSCLVDSVWSLNRFTGLTTNVQNQTFGTTLQIRNNPGLNPVGHLAVSLPATGVNFAVQPYDGVYYVSGGTVSAITHQGTATGLTAGTFPVNATETLAISYTVAPTVVYIAH